jgi:hypothetical protein
MKKPNIERELRLRPRPSEIVEISIALDTLATIKRVAETRDMSYQALIKFYIGQGLRQDLSQMAANHLMESAAEVLAQRLGSAEEAEKILDEIRYANKKKWHPWMLTHDRPDQEPVGEEAPEKESA